MKKDDRVKVISLLCFDIANTDLKIGQEGIITDEKYYNSNGDNVFDVKFDSINCITDVTSNFNEDGTYQMFGCQLEVIE